MSVTNVFRQQLGTVKVVMMAATSSQLYRCLFPKRQPACVFSKLEPYSRCWWWRSAYISGAEGAWKVFFTADTSTRKAPYTASISDSMFVCWDIVCSHVCVVGRVCISICISGVSLLCSFIGVIHAGVIEGNHFTAELYCNYGDERLLFRDTKAKWWWDCLRARMCSCRACGWCQINLYLRHANKLLNSHWWNEKKGDLGFFPFLPLLSWSPPPLLSSPQLLFSTFLLLL